MGKQLVPGTDIVVPQRQGRGDRIEVFPGKRDGLFYGRRVAGSNGQTRATTEGYSRRDDCVKGARKAFPDIAETVIYVD